MIPPRKIGRADLMPLEQYARERAERRRRITEVKKRRRISVGPFATFYFENYDTMWRQIHEMLHIEKGGEAQIQDELDAYNPLIPNGDELVATVMFEIAEAARRTAALYSIGGIENHMLLSIEGDLIRGVPDPERENTSAEGKASSVQFVHFPLDDRLKTCFVAGTGPVMLGFDHPNYGHLAIIPPEIRKALAQDLRI